MTQDIRDIPVVLFVYRRPDTLEQVLRCLRTDNVPSLHIFSDGPKTPAQADEVAQVRRLIHSIDWCERVIEESETNLGLGVSVRRGVSKALGLYGLAIFWEDDLTSVPGTYAYLAAALRHYADEPRVMSVTAWTHPRITPPDLGSAPYFDGKGESWAWGTWARAWLGMEESATTIMRSYQEMGGDIERYGTDLPKMAAEADAKNLWAVGWFYHNLRHNGLCLRPPWSMVEQICWETDRSTTSLSEMMGWANAPLRPCPPIPDVWPIPEENPWCAPLWRDAVDGPSPVFIAPSGSSAT